MQLLKVFAFLYFLVNTTAFLSKSSFPIIDKTLSSIKSIQKNELQNNENNTNSLFTVLPRFTIQEKTNGLLKLIRPVNIAPTFLLASFGGWLMNPSIYSLIHLSKYIVALVDTVIIMSSSMVINDIYDIEIDKLNNPTRPLVTGVVTVKEAILFSVLLLSIVEYLSITFLSPNLQFIIHGIIIYINIYTPVLKKITLIKNISCASLVSFSVFFSALSTTNTILSVNPNFNILSITLNLIFFGSLYNELLLDMCDREGDKKNKIYTLPVIFGNQNTWIFTALILNGNILLNAFSLYYIFDYYKGLLLILICSPMLYDLYKIEESKYDKTVITKAVKQTSNIMFLILLYLGFLTIL